jgi:GNAT superfamily N-acetyltransferase
MAVAAVHPALEEDIPEITRIQRETWLTAYAELLPPTVLAGLDAADAEDAWRSAWRDGAARLFVATEGSWTVGFCSAGRAPDSEVAAADGSLPPDAATTGLIGTLLVEPRWGRRGHGGRLLGTAAAALRAEGATRGIVWVPERDSVSRAFFVRAGWSPDGTARTLDAGGQPLRELRLSGTLDLVLKDELES